MSDLRQKLLEAKKDIETKSGQSFSHEYIALADLISAFVAIKLADSMEKIPEPAPLMRPVGKPSDDFLYGNN
jgi:hypothetical protein